MKIIKRTGIIKLLMLDDYFETSNFSYNYSNNNILYCKKPIEPKIAAINFGIYHDVEFSVNDFQDALYYFARINTESHENYISPTFYKIHNYLYSKSVTNITITQLLVNVYGEESKTDKKLQITASKYLKNNGWIKKKSNSKVFWVKESSDSTNTISLESDTLTENCHSLEDVPY